MNQTEKTIDSILFTVGLLDDETEKVVGQLFKRLEKEIRQDQDKITRHACAESVAKGVQRRIKGFTASQKFYDKAHQSIMNTKAL